MHYSIESDENVPCFFCEKKSSIIQGEHYCKDCKRHMCQICLETHNEFPANDGHEVQSLGKYGPWLPQSNQNATRTPSPQTDPSRASSPIAKDGSITILHQREKDSAKSPLSDLDDLQNCEEHDGEKVIFYCQMCGEVCCRKCIDKKHSECLFQKIGYAIKESRAQKEEEKTMGDLKTLLSQIDTAVKKQQAVKEAVIRENDDIVKEIEKHAEVVRVLYDQLERKSLEEVKAKETERVKKIEATIKDLFVNKEMLENSIKSLDNDTVVKESKQFQDLKAMQKLVKDIGQKIDSSNNGISDGHVRMKFNIKKKNLEFMNFIQQASSLGDFEEFRQGDSTTMPEQQVPGQPITRNNTGDVDSNTQTTDVNRPQNPQISRPPPSTTDGTGEKSPDPMPRGNSQVNIKEKMPQFQLIEKYAVKLPTDRNKCHITGMCQASDGKIIVADFGNKKLKIFDNNGLRVRRVITLPAGPIGLCECTPGLLAVALDSKPCYVRFENLTGGATDGLEGFNIGEEATGIAYANHFLYACQTTYWIFSKQSYIGVYSMGGQRLKTITANFMFKNLVGISRSMDSDTMLVTDYSKGLISVNLQNNHCNVLIGLEKLQGLCVDESRHVYVCGKCSNTVARLEHSDDLWSHVVLTANDGLNSPYTVCFDVIRQQLLVANENSNEILIFKVQGN